MLIANIRIGYPSLNIILLFTTFVSLLSLVLHLYEIRKVFSIPKVVALS